MQTSRNPAKRMHCSPVESFGTATETNHPLLPPDGCLYSAEHHQQRLRQIHYCRNDKHGDLGCIYKRIKEITL